MDQRMLGAFFLLIVIIYTPRPTNADVPKETVDTITAGLGAGQALAEVLKDGNFRQSLVNIGNKLAPFLSALGPLAGLAFNFIPTGDSPELSYMKKKFKEVNNKLDVVIAEFDEVKKAIGWSTVQVSYGTYERKIRAAEENLIQTFSLQRDEFKVAKDTFIRNYENDFDNSLQKLYDAIVNDDHVFSKNILDAAIKQTENHKRKVEKFSLGLVQLLVEGIEVTVSYYALKRLTHGHVIREWDRKMKTLNTRLVEVSEQVKNAYISQLNKDTNTLINKHYTLGNKKLLLKIYNFVYDKFDWRYWFVAVYNDFYGHDKHTIYTCGGGAYLHKKGKNIVISSQDKIYSHRFKVHDASKILSDVEGDINGCSAETRKPGDRARTLVQRMWARTGSGCVPYALKMAVKTGEGLWFINSPNHRAWRKVEKRKYCRWDCSFWSCSVKTTYWSYDMVLFG